MNEEIIALFIPIFAIACSFGIAFYGIYKKMKYQEMMHEERKIAMEKGLSLPVDFQEYRDPVTAHKNAALANRKAFVICFFIGLAFMIISGSSSEGEMGYIGTFLLMLSFAFLVISFFKYNLSTDEKKRLEQFRDFRSQDSSSSQVDADNK